VKDKSFVLLATMETPLGKVFEKNERVKSHQRWNGEDENGISLLKLIEKVAFSRSL